MTEMLTRLLKVPFRLLFLGPDVRSRTLYRLRVKLQGIDVRKMTTADLGVDSSKSNDYEDSGYIVSQIFRTIPRGKAVLDIGCGKGGAMLAMLSYFERVDGIEICPQLIDIARKNLRWHAGRCQIFGCDATAFEGYGNYDTFYLYNPFPENVVCAVMEQIQRANPAGRIVYVNPIFGAILSAMGYTETFRFECAPQVAVYQRHPSTLSGSRVFKVTHV
jgi:predicted RNA methylase